MLDDDVGHVRAERESVSVQRLHQRKVETQHADAATVAADSHKGSRPVARRNALPLAGL